MIQSLGTDTPEQVSEYLIQKKPGDPGKALCGSRRVNADHRDVAHVRKGSHVSVVQAIYHYDGNLLFLGGQRNELSGRGLAELFARPYGYTVTRTKGVQYHTVAHAAIFMGGPFERIAGRR